MSKLSHYIKLRNSAIGCDAKQFECDKYLDCDSCLEDKIKEHDKQIRTEVINEYYNKINEKLKTDTNLKDTIRDIHDNVAQEMYCKGIDDFANYLVKQGILGNRCISDGEITDYGKVYAKKYKEQLKAGGKNEN